MYAVDLTINRNGPDLLFPGRERTESNAVQYLSQKCSDASRHSSLNLPREGVTHIPGAGSITNLQAANGWNIPRPRIDLNNTAGEAASVPSSGVVSSDTEPEKVWHYKDPSGNVQGPFTLSQLSKWTSYFPSGMKIWLTFESEENSLLLTEVLSTQQKDIIQPTPVINNNKSAWAGSGQDKINPSMTENITSPIGYNVVYSSGLPSQSSDRPLRRENPNFMGEALPSTTGGEPLTSSVQIQHQANYSCTIPSFAGSYRSPGSHGDGVPREKIGEHNNRQETGGLCSPTPPPKSHNSQSTMKPQTGVCATQKQLQNDSKSNSQMDFRSQKVPIPTPKQSERDLAISCGTSSPSEFEAAQRQEHTCWNLTTKPIARDEIQVSIASAKPESCSRSNLVDGRESNSALGIPSQSRAPACSAQSTSFTCTSSSSKTEDIMNLQKPCPLDASNASVNLLFEPKIGSLLSPGTQDQYPSPTPKLERKQPVMDKSGSTSAAPEDSATKAYDHSSIAFASETSGPPSCKFVGLQLLKETQTSCVEERDLKDGGCVTQTEQLKGDATSAKRDNIIVSSVSDAEVCDVLESLTEQNCGTYNVHAGMPSENFTPASAEEERPQCSSPIALSPWGEPSYYQGGAVDSALWGVQDDPSNDMWSLSSPTPALQPSSGNEMIVFSCFWC